MEREILAVDVCKASAMPGNAGRYMSMANGLMVASAPRMRIIRGRLWLGWDFEDLGLGWRGRAWPLPVRVVASCTERPYQPDAEDKESEVPDSGVHSTNYTAGLTSRAKRMIRASATIVAAVTPLL